ncbi:MAG: hypothetical protein Tsb009_35750 [Planctomycetaceae bacterium]
MNQPSLSFQFKERVEPDLDNYEVDPLGELNAFERGIRQFNWDHNRRVVIGVSDCEISFELRRDLSRIYFELPTEIAELHQGANFAFMLPELSWTIRFFTEGETVRCVMSDDPDDKDYGKFALEKSQVVTALVEFITEIVMEAVETGYVTEEDAKEFLAPVAEL